MKIMTIALAAVALLATTAGFAVENTSADVFSHQRDVGEGKLYVTREMVHVAPEGMYLCLGAELFRITTLGADSNGLYISEAEVLVTKGKRKRKSRWKRKPGEKSEHAIRIW